MSGDAASAAAPADVPAVLGVPAVTAAGHPRVAAPELAPGAKLAGPVSYFPSIEKTYGRPMQEWLDIVADSLAEGKAHMEAVAVLKDAHDMGHGHANAVVAYVKKERA